MYSGPVERLTHSNSNRCVITRHMSLYHSNGHMWWPGHNNPLLQRSGLSAAEPATLYYLRVAASFGSFVLCRIVQSVNTFRMLVQL